MILELQCIDRYFGAIQAILKMQNKARCTVYCSSNGESNDSLPRVQEPFQNPYGNADAVPPGRHGPEPGPVGQPVRFQPAWKPNCIEWTCQPTAAKGTHGSLDQNPRCSDISELICDVSRRRCPAEDIPLQVYCGNGAKRGLEFHSVWQTLLGSWPGRNEENRGCGRAERHRPVRVGVNVAPPAPGLLPLPVLAGKP